MTERQLRQTILAYVSAQSHPVTIWEIVTAVTAASPGTTPREVRRPVEYLIGKGLMETTDVTGYRRPRKC